jgi:hypothetical protein
METAVDRTLDLFTVTKKDAQARMDLLVSKGNKQAEVLLQDILTMRIDDELIPHIEMRVQGAFRPDLDDTRKKQFLLNGQPLRRHALGQVCGITHLPLSYVDFLLRQDAWGLTLAAENVEQLLQKLDFKRQNNAPRKFLIRSVDTEVRGFLSRSYGIHLSTNPLLPRFLDECKAKDALPIGTAFSAVRFHVKCALPYVYEVIKGQYLAVGLSFHNSDFGAGKFSIRETIWDPINNRGAIMGEPAASLIDKNLRDRVHLGPMLSENDLKLSNSARANKTEEAAKLVRNTVQAMFSQGWIEELCFTIEKAQAMQIPWSAIIRRTGASLLKEEVELLQKLLIDGDPTLPPLQRGEDGLPIPTMWWAASAIASLASKEDNPERVIDLQETAGRFIKKE